MISFDKLSYWEKDSYFSDIDFLIADESHNLTCNKHSTDGKKLAKTIKNYDNVKKLYFYLQEVKL